MHPNELVRFHLEFFKPMSGTSEADFTFKPAENQTYVTWDVTGKKNLVSKAFCLFVSMDNMIGGRLAMGLADLKTVAESGSKP